MKKLAILFTSVVLMTISCVISVNAHGYKEVAVTVNGNRSSINGLIKGDRTLVPLRGVFEELNYKIYWYSDSKIAVFDNSEYRITLQSGNDYFKCLNKSTNNEAYIKPDVPQEIIDGYFYVPLRAVSESIGANVGWDGNNYIASVNTGDDSKHNDSWNKNNSNLFPNNDDLSSNSYSASQNSDTFDYSGFRSNVIKNFLKSNNVKSTNDLYKFNTIELNDSDLTSDTLNDLKLLPAMSIVIIKDKETDNFKNVVDFFDSNGSSKIYFCFNEDSFCGGSVGGLSVNGTMVVNSMIIVNSSNYKEYYDYYNKNADYNKLKQKILDKIIKSGDSDFDKILAVHDYIVSNTEYDYDNYKNGTIPNESYEPYYVLKNGVGVCEGYAKATKALLEMTGIETYYVVGSAYSFNNWGGHGWNIVKLDGKYYHLDVTWDDPVSTSGDIKRYDYFLISDSTISEDHKWDKSEYPKCNSDYGYNPKKGSYSNEDFAVYSNDITYDEEENEDIAVDNDVSKSSSTQKESKSKKIAEIYNASIENSISSDGTFVFKVEANEYTEEIDVVNHTTGDKFSMYSYSGSDKHIFKKEITLPESGNYAFEIDSKNEDGIEGNGLGTNFFMEIEKDAEDETNKSVDSDITEIEDEILNKLNRERIFDGSDPLVLDEDLSDISAEFCSRLKNGDYAGYDSNGKGHLIYSRLRDNSQYGCIVIENVAKDCYDADSIFQCMMESDINKNAFLNSDFSNIGIAFAYPNGNSSVCCFALAFE